MRVYTEQEVKSLLSGFGNYLLSDKRKESFATKLVTETSVPFEERASQVHKEDIDNWGGLLSRPQTAADLVVSERIAHTEREGWSNSADDTYLNNELAYGAVAYALPMVQEEIFTRGRVGDNDVAAEVAINLFVKRSTFWKFAKGFWKPSMGSNEGRVKELVKAGSLILAEIDRLLRLRRSNGAKSYTEDKTFPIIKAKHTNLEQDDMVQVGTTLNYFIPAGTPVVFPDGWLLCNGGLLEKEQYPDLFHTIGDTYCFKSDLDDEERFRLPNMLDDTKQA